MTDRRDTYISLCQDAAFVAAFKSLHPGLNFETYGPNSAWANMGTTRRFVAYGESQGRLKPAPTALEKHFNNAVRPYLDGAPAWSDLGAARRSLVRQGCRECENEMAALGNAIADGSDIGM